MCGNKNWLSHPEEKKEEVPKTQGIVEVKDHSYELPAETRKPEQVAA